MPRSISLTFPWPPKELSPNVARRLHWAKKATATKQYRSDCGWEAKLQTWDKDDKAYYFESLASPVLATVTFHVKDKIRRDIGNLDASLKPLWDGIVDAGILADDDYKHLRHGESKVVVEPKGTKHIEVTLEEVE